MASQVISHYRIVKKLGAGGMGEVYLAEDTKLRRRVAIKSLLPDSLGDEQARSRLLREARAAARLEHPNICAIHEVVETEDSSFIVMQYVEGDNLAALIKQKTLTLEGSLDVVKQVADALAAAHAHGIIHRDIKPQNIIVTPQAHVKVLDFGLAKFAGQRESTDSDTQSLTVSAGGGVVIMGTAAYMSPEQASLKPVDQRSDLFSLGAVLYECVTGSRPFSGANFVDVCIQVATVDPVTPSALDPKITTAVDKVILRALSKAPEARYQSAVEFREDLAKVLIDLQREQQENTQRVPHPTPKPWPFHLTFPRTTRRTKLILLACAAAMVLTAILLWRPTPYQPKGEAARRYEEGVNALRDGAYVKATRHLALAVQADNQFALAHARLAEAWLELDHRKKAESEMLLARSLADRLTLSRFEDAYLQAANRTLVRDLDGAIEKYKEALALASRDQKAVVYFDLGRAYERNENLESAKQSYNSALALNPGNAAALMRLGVLAAREMNSSADARFREAEQRYRDVENVEGVTQAVFLRGYLLNTRDQLNDARATLEQALGRARALDNQPQQVAILLHLSNIACSEGNITQAETIATEAVELAKHEGMESLAVDGLIAVGNAYLIGNNLDKAEHSFQSALDLAGSYEGERSENTAMLSLASLNDRRANQDETIKLLETCLPFFERGRYKRETSQALALLARAYRKKGEYDTALSIFQRSMEVLEELGDRGGIATCHAGIATVLSYREQYKDALEHYLQSSALHESLGDSFSQGSDLMNVGRMQFQLGRYEDAEASFTRASELAARTGPNRGLQVWIEIYAGRMALSQGSYLAAESKSKEGLRLADPTSKEERIIAEMTIGEAAAMSGRVAEGLGFCQNAVMLATEIRNPRHLSESRLALARVLFQSGDFSASLATARDAERDLERLGKRDSLWRALVVEALCLERAGDHGTARAVASRAIETLSVVESQLGPEAYQVYLTRPDVVADRKQFEKIK